METHRMKYGMDAIDVPINEAGSWSLVHSKGIEDKKSEDEVIRTALKNPIDSPLLRNLIKAGETVCIIISDITRSWQKTHMYLPYIIEELNKAGVNDSDITLLCATGSHRCQTKDEHRMIIGEKLAERFEVIDHNCKNQDYLVRLGITSFGTPVEINKIALDSDHIILTGAIVFHDLAGWGGGKKSILPGISSFDSIMANHKLSLNPRWGEGTNFSVRCGNVVNNPVHLDMLEAAAFVKPTFLFNVIIDGNGDIAQAVAGDYIKAHEAGQDLVDKADSASIMELADIVVASAGGYPKDIDLYQASKALINAKEAVKSGGTIILLAECIEGFGGSDVKYLIQDFRDNLMREQALRESFTVAKYTGYLIAEIAENYEVILITSLESKQLENANIKCVSGIREALQIAEQRMSYNSLVYYMPNASSTLPRLVAQTI